MISILSEPCRAIIRAIVDGPLAWQTPAQLARTLKLDIDTTTDAIAWLDVADWLDPWEMADTIFVTLSTLGAERLRVRPVLIGRSDELRFASVDDPDPGPPRAAGRFGVGDDCLHLVPDPDPGPEAAAEAAERAEWLASRTTDDGIRIDLLPRPSILIGLGLSPWPGPAASTQCPACRSKPIQETAYCMVCDRWGFDHLLFARKKGRSDPSRRARAPLPSRTNPASGAQAKAARKAKRNRKWIAIAEKAKADRGANSQPNQGKSRSNGSSSETSANPASRSACR